MGHILFFWLSSIAIAQPNWISSESLMNEFSEEKKQVLIYFNTDWCKICKMQEKVVFEDSSVSKMMNKHFYLLKVNAESKDDLDFFGRTYRGATQNQYSEFAEIFATEGKSISFPTIVILNEKLELTYRSNAYLSKNEFKAIINTNNL